jgi:hypothetical protein
MLKLMIEWGEYGKLLIFDSVSGKVRRTAGEDDDESERVRAAEPVKHAGTTREPEPTETSVANEPEPVEPSEQGEPVEAAGTTETTAASEQS